MSNSVQAVTLDKQTARPHGRKPRLGKVGWHVISCTVTREPSTPEDYRRAWAPIERRVLALIEEKEAALLQVQINSQSGHRADSLLPAGEEPCLPGGASFDESIAYSGEFVTARGK